MIVFRQNIGSSLLLTLCLFLIVQYSYGQDLKGLKDVIKQKEKDQKGLVEFSERIGISIYDGSFKCTFIEEKDGLPQELEGGDAALDFTGTSIRSIVVKLENFEINRNQKKDKYKIEFECGGKLNGLKLEKIVPRTYLENQGEEVYFYFKPIDNTDVGFVDLSYTLYKFKKDGYETILAGSGKRLTYSITGIANKKSDNSGIVSGSSGEIIQASFDMAKEKLEVGEWVQITNTSKNATSFTWEFDGGDPPVSDSKDPYISFTLPGQRRIKLTASDDNGVETSTEMYVLITEKKVEEELQVDAPKMGRELFEEIAGMTWEDALSQNKVQESDYFEFNTANEIHEILEANKEIIPRVKQESKGSFIVKLDNAVPPFEIEVLNNKEGVKVFPPKGNIVEFTLSDSRDHEVRLEDRRGKAITFILPGSVEQLLAKSKASDSKISFNINGGRKPYFVEFSNIETGVSEEFLLGSCTSCEILITDVKERLEQNFGLYNIIIKDRSKSFQKTLKDTFNYKAKSTKKIMPLIGLFLLGLTFIVLVIVVVMKNK